MTAFPQSNLPTAPVMNPTVARLFSAINARPSTNELVGKGKLITFGYSGWQHDPYPLLIVTDVIQFQRVRGVNLHYLTFPYIRNLLRMGANNPSFSYSNIKADQYITNAFRSYKWQGIRQIKMLDSAFLLQVMAAVRSFDPSQVAEIRRSVQEQIQRLTNPGPVQAAPVSTTPVVPAPVQAPTQATPGIPQAGPVSS